MTLVISALGIIVNGVIGVVPDLALNIAASIIYDTSKKIFQTITIKKGRNINILHPVIETALVYSYYNSIIFCLNKTRDYYKKLSKSDYKKEILLITSRIKDLKKLLSGSSQSGYSVIEESIYEMLECGLEENNNRVLSIARNNLIGLPEKAIKDLDENFIGIFLIFFKEKYASDEILRSLLNFDLLRTNLSISYDINCKIDSLINKHIDVESELRKISDSLVSINGSEYLEIQNMLIGIQTTLKALVETYKDTATENILLEQSYLDSVYNKYKYIEFPTFYTTKKQIKLKEIYFPLELINRIAVTIDSNGMETKIPISEIDNYNAKHKNKNPFIIEKMSVFDVFSKNRSVFIIGENGSGKTITAKHLVCCLSGYNSSDSEYWTREKAKLGINNADEIPIFISLIEYFKFGEYGRGAFDILNYLQKQFSLQENLIGYLKSKLSSGKVLVIIDDCNFKDIQAGDVVQDIVDLINNYPRNRYVIFRNNGNDEFYDQYTDFDEIKKFELAKLSVKKMREMTDKYISKVSLLHDIKDFSFESFYENINELGLLSLVENPYWYVLILLMQCNLGNIPLNSFYLHDVIVEDMIKRFTHSLENFSENDRKNLILSFELLSVSLFESVSNNSSVNEVTVLEVLNQYFSYDKSSKILSEIKKNHCELFIFNNVNNSLTYMHKPLISTLVAKYYKSEKYNLSELIDNTLNDIDVWLEPFSLLFDDNNFDLLAFALFIIYNTAGKDFVIKTKIGLYILSKVNISSFIERSERRILVENFYESGQELIIDGNLSLKDRIIIAQELSIMSVKNSFNPNFDLCFCKIQAGTVVLGNDNLTHGEPYEYNIDYDYYAGKYPVTNFEYQQFLAENKNYPIPYDESNIWNKETRCVDKRYLNHPVVGVNFNDAIEYCKWFQSKVIVPSGYCIWLPTDPEWMKMYRGGKKVNGKKNKNASRIYPWGDKWIEGYANLPKLNTPTYATTAVGILIEGVCQYGCYDTCGNVLEWTTTSWGGFNPDIPEYNHPYNSLDGREDLKIPGLRITRGGSYLFSEGDAKCSCRLEPSSKFPDTGFRIFAVPKK